MKRLTVAQVPIVRAALLKRQGYKCPVCEIPLQVVSSTPCLDHDHSTGVIRGVLCRNCNGLEGKLRSIALRGRRTMGSDEFLGRVIMYWRYHAVDRVGVLHPTHKTVEEKRVLINKRARVKRAKAKKG